MPEYQYVTLVAQGGTPIRLANQSGAPFPTTGQGALVFANGPTLTNPILNGAIFNSPFGFAPGTLAAPSLYFTYSNDATTGMWSSAKWSLNFAANSTALGSAAYPGDWSLTRDLAVGRNITAGVWQGTTIAVGYGGTGLATITSHGVPYGNGTAALGVTAAGTTGQVLVGNTGAAPSWAALAGIGVTSIGFGTTGLTPSAATAGAITVAGTLVAANGGTGQSSYAVGDILYASGATALSKLADVATGNALISGGVTTAPSWGKIGLTTHVSGTLPVANGGTGVTASTGTVAVVLSTSPTLVTPILGVATATSINKLAITAPAAGATLTIADGKTFTSSNTLTLTGTDGASVAFGAGGTVLYGNQAITLSGDVSGSGTTAITTTLATVNANVGSFGSSTAIPAVTVNAKGLITAISTSAVIAPAGTLTGATLAVGVTASSLTSVGTIATGVWQGTVVAGQYGGTGVANTGKTITLGGNLTTSGAFAATLTLTNTTTVTFPTTGTLATLAGAEALTNKSVNGVTLNGAGSSSLFLNQAGSYVASSTSGSGQVVSSFTGAVATGTTTIPNDDTIPQNTEGDQYLSLAITPASATSKLEITVLVSAAGSVATANTIVALFQDSTANALAVTTSDTIALNVIGITTLIYTMTSGTTSPTTFKVRVGQNVGTTTINGRGGARDFGGVCVTGIIIRETLP